MSRIHFTFAAACVVAGLALAPLARADEDQEPLAAKYLYEGKLAEGEKALLEHLQAEPKDDQARFGLGAVQTVRAFETLFQNLYKHGLRTNHFMLGLSPEEFEEFAPHPKPETATYEGMRKVTQQFIDDLNKAESTLAKVSDANVALPLKVALIKFDPTGRGKPIDAAFVFARGGEPIPEGELKEFFVAFDRGDVCWLRGYLHFVAALGELIMAVDSQEFFNCAGHIFYVKTDTPYTFLLDDREENENFARIGETTLFYADAIASLHLLLRLELAEPERMKTVLEHLEAMTAMSREMWTHYLAEDDNYQEWIPNPRQTSVTGVEVTEEMVERWLQTLDEVDAVLQGKKLIPFWRGKQGEEQMGVNLRRVFTEPRTIDVILWVQGTAAAPYLEKGELTEFANPRFLRQLDETFGGFNFFGFAFWFN